MELFLENGYEYLDHGIDECYGIHERDRAFAHTNFLVLCVRYSEDLRDTIAASELACLPPGAYLVNVARGRLVSYAALLQALRCGHLRGAALDVFWDEPIATNDPLLTMPNVITTPHIAGVTQASFAEIADAVAVNIERLRKGEPLLNCVV